MKQRFRPITSYSHRNKIHGSAIRLLWKLGLWLIFASFIMLFILFNRQVRPSVQTASIAMAKHIATQALNSAVYGEIVHEMDTDSLIQIDRSVGKDGITIAHLNLQEMALLQMRATQHVNEELTSITHQRIQFPISQFVGGSALSFLDIRIPITLSLLGTAQSAIFADVKSVGTNQAVHIIYLDVTVEVNVMTPFMTKPIVLSSRTPIAYLVLSGPTPYVYYPERPKVQK